MQMCRDCIIKEYTRHLGIKSRLSQSQGSEIHINAAMWKGGKAFPPVFHAKLTFMPILSKSGLAI